jgi:flagellar biosynthetic protein FlhB
MADPDKTEKATPKRRDKARGDGAVARSNEVNQSVVLLATLIALSFEAPRILGRAEGIMHDGLARAGRPGLVENGAGLGGLLSWGISGFVGACLPVVVAAAAAGILASVAQVGLKFSGKAIKPSLKKINPGAGLKQLASKQKLTELGKSLAKLAIVGGVAVPTLWGKLGSLGLMVGEPPGAFLVDVAHLVFSIAIRVVAALLVVAAADFVYQKRSFEKNLRMTKHEVKEEGKEGNLPPEVRGKIRQKQMEAHRRRMLADVPTADVVVVNPTHYAVALRYDGSAAAPEVVAKGLDHLALKIREIAEEAGVPIIEQPPLARALYREVDLGHQIPEEFFGAVAEILAFVFRTARRVRRPALSRAVGV